MLGTRRHTVQDVITQDWPYKLMLDLEQGGLLQDAEVYTKLLVIKAAMSGDAEGLKDILGRSSNPSELVKAQDLSGCTALHVAARFNHVNVAEVLLSHGADCDSIAWTTVSPLQVACRYRHEEMVRLLLRFGSDPLKKLSGDGTVLHSIALNSTVKVAELVFGSRAKPPVKATDDMGMTPLHKAAQAGNSGMCQWLLSHGANPAARDVRHMTPVMVACTFGHSDVIGTLLFSYTVGAETKRKIIYDVDKEGMTALHHAILGGRYEAVQALLLWGADPNVMDAHSISPLHLCVAEGNADLVSLLAAHKAHLSQQDSRGRTPLHRAVELKHKEIVQCLLKQGADPNTQDTSQTIPLLLACGCGQTDLVQLLCESGADLQALNFRGQTCLHVAIAGGHLEVVRLLLQRYRGKCDLLHTQDLFEQTVLHEAAKQMDHQFVEELLCQGCSTEVKDVEGLTPLHVASRSGGYQTVLKLAEAASDINAKTPEGKTALYIASEFGHRDVMVALVKAGADVKIIDISFKNSLMAAASGGFTDIVNDLLEMGVQVNHKDQEHNTALHHACLHGRLATVKTLLDRGACVSTTNIYGQTALAMAVEMSRSEVAAMLMEHSSWEESLSVPSKKNCSIFSKMIETTPAAAQIVLDKCVKTSDLPATDEQYTIEFNFKYIDSQPSGKTAPECVFVTMLRCGREDLLSHPLCQSNLSYKWYTYGKASFLVHALIQIGFLFSLTVFYAFMPKPHEGTYKCKVTLHIKYANLTNEWRFHGNLSDVHNFTGIEDSWVKYEAARFQFGFMQIIQYIMYAFMALQLAVDVYSCFAVGFKYVTSFHFISQTIIGLLVLFSTIPFGFEPCDNEWRGIAYALFIFFVKTSVTCQSMDKIGVLFTMFIEVAKTMLKISILMIFFIPAVSIPLSIMVNQEGFKNGNSLLSTFAMALGELNFRDTYVMTNNSPYAVDVYFMFPAICLLLNCSLMNLMIGVAVGDIAKVEKTAYLSRLKAHLHYMIEAEQLLFFVVRRKLLKNKLVVHPNSKSKSFNDRVKRTFLYCEQISFIQKKTESSSFTEPELALVKELKDQKAILEKLTKATDGIMDTLQKIDHNSPQRNDGHVRCSMNVQNTPSRRNDSFVKESRQTDIN